MCIGGRRGPSSHETRPFSISQSGSLEKKGNHNGGFSSPLSRTGATTQTGGGSNSCRQMGGTRGKEENLPTERTAKSPAKKGSTESSMVSHKSRNQKSMGLDLNADTYKSTKDDPTLRNLQESKREGGNAAETTEVCKSEWSIMGKAPAPKKTAAHREPPPRPPPVLPPTPSIPTRPVPLPISNRVSHPIPAIPSPSTTPPIPIQPISSDEKTAMNLSTVRTQRTLMDDEIHSKYAHTPILTNQDASSQMETKRVSISVRNEDMANRGEKPLHITSQKSTTIEPTVRLN